MNNFIIRINKIYNYIFGENFYKKINCNFDSKLTRSLIINNLIKKKYETYLKISYDKDILFNFIKKKIGIDPVTGQ